MSQLPLPIQRPGELGPGKPEGTEWCDDCNPDHGTVCDQCRESECACPFSELAGNRMPCGTCGGVGVRQGGGCGVIERELEALIRRVPDCEKTAPPELKRAFLRLIDSGERKTSRGGIRWELEGVVVDHGKVHNRGLRPPQRWGLIHLKHGLHVHLVGVDGWCSKGVRVKFACSTNGETHTWIRRVIGDPRWFFNADTPYIRELNGQVLAKRKGRCSMCFGRGALRRAAHSPPDWRCPGCDGKKDRCISAQGRRESSTGWIKRCADLRGGWYLTAPKENQQAPLRMVSA